MSETLEQLEWIRERLIPLRLEWTEDAVVEAGAEAYRRFPESETVGRALLDYSMLPRESLDLDIQRLRQNACGTRRRGASQKKENEGECAH